MAKKAVGNIEVHKASVNNLKAVDVVVPRNSFTVVTGVSGSGKSSLAFDTLSAEGQRRYVESLSAYARQFMGRMKKPDCESIKGLPPAIAIQQKVNTRNPRSTVGTSTEIYDYMRLLFGRIGRTISPVSGREVHKDNVNDVVALAQSLPEGTRIAVTSPLYLPPKREFDTHLDVLTKAGYSRLVYDNSFVSIEDVAADKKTYPRKPEKYLLLIDRLVTSSNADELSRLAESAETAFFEGHDNLRLLVYGDDGTVTTHDFSTTFEADGISFLEPSDQMFNFNNPYGACPRCEGFGRTVGIDEALVVPNPSLSVYDNAVMCWRGEKMSQYRDDFIHAAGRLGFPVHRPYQDLDPDQKRLLWKGGNGVCGIDDFFSWVETQQHKIQYRVMLARYRGKTICPVCEGRRLRKEAFYVHVGGENIHRLVTMPVSDLRQWFDNLRLDDRDACIADRILVEIKSRLRYLDEVGLGYLTLDRLSNSLSGGESQRINLATSLGSSLVGSLYILDEPSIGLHPRDTERLIGVLKNLRKLGNTVLVVEHDEEIMRAADYLIDVGPDAGENGGHIVYQGPFSGIADAKNSHTADFLNHVDVIAVPKTRRKWNQYVQVNHACEHNLKDITVRFPLNVMTVVTGVSGSGKSTLVRDILYRALNRHLGNPGDAPGRAAPLTGDLSRISNIDFVDQNPIGRSSRSNPATYVGAYDEIRRLFAGTQLAKQLGLTAGAFSFNTEGGRCEQCKGEGTVTIEMQFMSDITVVCDECHGRRFKPEILDIKYNGKNITDVLEMTVDQAIAFFSADADDLTARKVARSLQALSDVGLGYIRLGQSSSTLSGGENQRVKLAYYLGPERMKPTMFIFDEPTTGLHPHDIKKLLDSFNRLIAAGHTIVIIEHNPDVIKCADHVIDIGPEGGDAGGNIVAEGTPETIASCTQSHTARYLRL